MNLSPLYVCTVPQDHDVHHQVILALSQGVVRIIIKMEHKSPKCMKREKKKGGGPEAGF